MSLHAVALEAMAAAYQPPISDDRGPLVIHPSWRAPGGRHLVVHAVSAVALFAGTLKLLGAPEPFSWLAAFTGISGLILATLALYLAAYMISTRITITADGIVVTHWFRATTIVPVSDISRVARCTVMLQKSYRSAIFAFSPTGRCVLSLYMEPWDQRDLDRIWRYVGITPEGSFAEHVSDRDLNTRFPGAF